MKPNRNVLFTVLCLCAFMSVCISEASVTIKGKPLDEIDDIVSTATDGGTAEMKNTRLVFWPMKRIRMDT